MTRAHFFAVILFTHAVCFRSRLAQACAILDRDALRSQTLFHLSGFMLDFLPARAASS
jgi:hypothetical protein